MLRRLLLFWLRLILWFFRDEAVRLNLTVSTGKWISYPDGTGWALLSQRVHQTRTHMAKIGDSFTARIAPTNSAGASAPVFNVLYEELGDSYDISVAPDGLSAVLVAASAGVGNTVRVTALTKGGATLSETVALPDVEAQVDEEAVALNLTVA